MTKLYVYEEVSQIILISEASILSQLGRLERLHHWVTRLTDCVMEGHLTASPVWWLTASALWWVTTSSVRWVTTSSLCRLTTPGATSDCVVSMCSCIDRPIVNSSYHLIRESQWIQWRSDPSGTLIKKYELSSEKRPRNAWGAPTKIDCSWRPILGLNFDRRYTKFSRYRECGFRYIRELPSIPRWRSCMDFQFLQVHAY